MLLVVIGVGHIAPRPLRRSGICIKLSYVGSAVLFVTLIIPIAVVSAHLARYARSGFGMRGEGGSVTRVVGFATWLIKL